MIKKRLPLFVCIKLSLMTAVMVAQELPFRSATAFDLDGTWEQIAVKEGLLDDITDPWFSARQYMDFSRHGLMKSVILENDNEDLTREEFKELVVNAPKTTRYEFLLEMPGLMKIQFEQGTQYRVLATYCEQGSEQGNAYEVRAGDVILSYVHPDQMKVLFYRLMRRTQGPQA